MLSTVRRFIYTKYWGILYVEHCGEIYLHKILRNNILLNTVGIFIYIKDLEIRCVEHCEQIYLHKILGNTLCWALREYVFTQNTWELLYVEHCGKIIYTKYLVILYLPTVFNIKYSPVLCVNKSSHSVQHKVFPSILCK